MRGRLRAHCAGRGPDGARLARYAGERRWPLAARRAPPSPTSSSYFVGRPAGMDEDAFERLLYRVRRRTENEIAESEIEGKEFFLHPLAFLPHDRLQGPDAGAADREVLLRAGQSAGHQRALPDPPALLHQHLSQLEAGAPLPLCGAQRRNQHHPRQHQLDERAPVGSGEPALRRADRQAVSGHHRPAAATRLRWTTRWSSSSSPAVRCPT